MTSGSKLVIVESPTKARKIGGYLGDGYSVMASVGHIRDLAQPSEVPASKRDRFGRFGVDVDHGFKPYYVVSEGKHKTVAELKRALSNADELYLATDEDREGEAIAWHLVETLKPKVPVRRMVFHEITKQAIEQSLESTRDVNECMVDAQETRRVLDRLFGYELSPVLWKKVGPRLSAGRVQSVATRMVVERERERMAFVKAQYADLTATLMLDACAHNGDTANSQQFEAHLVQLDGKKVATSQDFTSKGTLAAASEKNAETKQYAKEPQVVVISEEAAKCLASDVRERAFTVVGVQRKPYRRRPQPPFTTSTLQQVAGNRLSMSARQTMRCAQSLYENGYITYMRTDSVTLSQEAIHAARSAVEELYGPQYCTAESRQYVTKTAGAQEAHECIRPAGSRFATPEELASQLSPEQLKLYRLIYQRTLASQMEDATGSTATIRLSCESNAGQAIFQASGTVIEHPGFLLAYGRTNDDDTHALPVIHESDVCKALEVDAQTHETQPPARYTEASLVKALESEEIGRPSTYATILSTIQDRGYVYERGRALVPSWLAFSVVKLLETLFPEYVDYTFTAGMENGLDRIARGDETGREWLTKFYFGEGSADTASIQLGLQEHMAHLGDVDPREINTFPIGEGLQVRVGRYGPYLEDSNHVDLEGKPKRASIPDTLAPDEITLDKAKELMESQSDGPRVLGVDPSTGGRVEVRTGRFGPYIALLSPANEDLVKDSAEESSKKAAKDGQQDTPQKMVSLFSSMDPQTITLDEALQLLSLPRNLGTVERTNATTGEVQECTIDAQNGRYGPYVTLTMPDGSTDSRSLASEEAIFTVTLDEANALFDQPKYGRRTRTAKPPLRELGDDPETGKPVTIKDGFYGAYITDGTTNRTLPKQYTPDSIDVETAMRLLAEKRAAGPVKRKTRKSAATKASSKTATKASSKKATTKTAKTAKTKATGTKKATAAESSASKKTATKNTSAGKTAVKEAAAKEVTTKGTTAKRVTAKGTAIKTARSKRSAASSKSPASSSKANE